MLVVSYDIKDDKLRTKFSKMLTKNGAVRLQYSVYEINNTERVMNNLMVIIENEYVPKFDGGDSVIIFDVSAVKLKKYGNAIHRDKDIVYFWLMQTWVLTFLSFVRQVAHYQHNTFFL